MNTVAINPAHLKSGDRILNNNNVFYVQKLIINSRTGINILRAKKENEDLFMNLEYYKDQVKVDKIIG